MLQAVDLERERHKVDPQSRKKKKTQLLIIYYVMSFFSLLTLWKLKSEAVS